jgi:hypothetical protein
MEWNLSLAETLAVLAVGGVLAFVADKGAEMTESFTDPTAKQKEIIALAGTALIYTAGVVIGTNRPAGGFITDSFQPYRYRSL